MEDLQTSTVKFFFGLSVLCIASAFAPVSPALASTMIAGRTVSEPLSRSLTRVTKKPFGLEVSPGHSPVHPERFSGYHTGVDFETSADEQNTDVVVYAICTGPLKLKQTVRGYGGVVIQGCTLKRQDVTVIYGHVRLGSVTSVLGQTLKAGQRIAVLGKGFSKETDGERKHLHLGIHKGRSINVRGYVRSAKELSAWIDSATLLR